MAPEHFVHKANQFASLWQLRRAVVAYGHPRIDIYKPMKTSAEGNPELITVTAGGTESTNIGLHNGAWEVCSTPPVEHKTTYTRC